MASNLHLPRPARIAGWIEETWNFLRRHNNRNAQYLIEQHAAYNNDKIIQEIYAPRYQGLRPPTGGANQPVIKPSPDRASEGKCKSRTIHDLHEVINTPVRYETILEPSPTHESSEENQVFQDWRLVAEELTVDEIRREKAIDQLLPYLSQSIRGPITIWSQEDVPLRCEADVSDRFETDVLKPCKRAINLFLKAWYLQYEEEPPFVDYDSRRYHYAAEESDPSSKKLKSFVDHVLLIRNNYGAGGGDKILVIIEEKKPESVKAVELAIYKRSKQGALVSDGPFNMNRHLSQLLKYVQTMACPYSVLVDCREFIAMEWKEVNQEVMKYPGENKAMSYWDMQGNGHPLRLSMLYLVIKSLRSLGYLVSPQEKEAREREKQEKKKKEEEERKDGKGDKK